MTAIGELFRQARREKAFSVADAARATTGSFNKNVRTLQAIESGQDVFPKAPLRDRLALALGIEETTLLAAMSQDFATLDEPLPPRVVVRLHSAVHRTLELPPDCTPEDAAAIAAQYSAETGRKTCVILSRIRSLYVEPDGRRQEAYGLPGASFSSLPASLRSKAAQRLSKAVSGTRREGGGPA